MEVILLSDQRNLGRRGELVRVKPGYARNFLVPQGLAMEATSSNLKYFQEQRKKIDARVSEERDAAMEVASELASVRLTAARRVGETETLYGSVTASDVGELLAEKGIEVDRRKIDIGGGIKTLGDHTVTIHLHHDVVAEITLTVVPTE